MGDAIKRLFHKRYRSTDKDFKPLQSLPYRDARPGPPPRRGSLPLRGNNTSSSNGPISAAALRASPTRPRRSASLGSTHSHLRQNRLRKAASDPARKGRPGDLLRSNFTVDGDIPPASPPLPGTALTSDDARYWRDTDGNANPLVRQLSTGAESRYGEDVADRVLAEFFPKPPVGPAGNHDLDSAERASDSSASLSGPLKNAVLRERGSYTLVDGDGFPSLEPSRSNNTQSRLFLDDSDEDSGGASSREHGYKRSPSSLKRKKGHPSGLRNFSNPRNDYSVQEPVRKYNKPDGFANASHDTEPTRSYLIEDSPEPPSLDGVVDLRDTEDTTYHSRYAPAVTHQTVFPEVHHTREEQIFREIHTHDVFHRILPIVDVEVLPARHFVPIEEGGLTEIPEEDVPGRTSNSQARNWVVAELVSKRTSDDTPMEPRQFSAREFPGTEGDERRYITEDGFERTETIWVHPPTVETGAKDSGQTEPLYVLPYRPIETQNEGHDVGEGNATTQKSLGGLTGGVRSCPFDECAEFEAQGRENGRGSSGQLVGHSVEAAQCNGA